MSKRVVVGMSGGVDSSLAALRLKEQGYEVIGLFMRNWNEEDENGCCSADADYGDVRSVCQKLDIPYYTIDLSKEYYDRVFKHFVSEYSRGRTPNPDVLCNKEIKFDSFVKHALALGADHVATGHYCNVSHTDGRHYLMKAKDEDKDQTYFLNQVSERQLEKVLFPIGNMLKSEVRELAEKYGLSTADKKDSTGVCFIGERNFRKFLSEYIPMKRGEIRTLDGKTVGFHDGVYYYTLGQRKGLGVGGVPFNKDGGRWFVAKKDVENNILYVSQGDQSMLYARELVTDGFNFVNGTPEKKEFRCAARIRHRQKEQNATCRVLENGSVKIEFDDMQRAIVEGQYATLYVGDVCIGGGVIDAVPDRDIRCV